MKVLFVSILVLIVDQVSKFFVKGLSIYSLGIKIKGLYPGEKLPVINKIFNITFVENPGIAFGLDFGPDFKFWVSAFTLLSGFALLFLLYKNRNKNFILRLSLALILGGAFGNLFDRLFYGVIYGYAPLFYGKVVDFFDIRIFKLYVFHSTFGNYIFNFADLAVTLGVILLFYSFNKQTSDDKNVQTSLEKYLAENKE